MFKSNKKYLLLLFFIIILLFSLNLAAESNQYLSLWHDTNIKQEIIDFVKRVSQEKNKEYIPTDQRHAVFDLDGTLLSEKPMYILGVISIEYLKEKAEENPKLASQQPYKAAIEKDMNYLWRHPNQFMGQPFHNKSQAEYKAWSLNYLQKHKHPKLKLKYIDLFYLPMLQLVRFLQDNQFQVWICSGSSQGFIRSFSEQYLGISPQNIIASQIDLNFIRTDSTVNFIRGDKFVWVNNHASKPIKIYRQLGVKPIFVFGNSSGDLQMLQLVHSNKKSHMICVLNHNDPQREYEYYHKDLLDHSKKNGWRIVNMKENFKTVFSRKVK